MTEIIKKQLRGKIDTLLEIHQGLKNLQRLTLGDLSKNIGNVWAVTFGLIAGIEAVLDISQYLLSDQDIKIDSYGSVPGKLEEAGIIDKNFSKKMRIMIGFRNRAIHNYPSLDKKQLYKILQEDVDDFKKFLEIAKSYLKKI